MMNAKACVILGLVALGLVALGGLALATEYVWDGDGPVSGGLWITPGNWVIDSSYPQNSNDNVYLEDVSPSATCTYTPSSALTVNNVTITGSSPTKMKLHVKDYALTAAKLNLNDYSTLEADQNLTVNTTTTLVDESWIAVAANKTCDLEDVLVADANAHLHATTNGTLKADDVTIDAHAPGASRGVRFSGGTWDIEDELILKSVQGSGAYVAKFWLDSGSVTPEFLQMDASDADGRRVELDIDQNFTIGTDSEALGGRYAISVAAGKTMNTKKLVLNAFKDDLETDGDIYFSVTGETGEGVASGQLVTEQ